MLSKKLELLSKQDKYYRDVDLNNNVNFNITVRYKISKLIPFNIYMPNVSPDTHNTYLLNE